MSVYLWKCEECGDTNQRSSSKEPRRCTTCGSHSAMTFKGTLLSALEKEKAQQKKKKQGSMTHKEWCQRQHCFKPGTYRHKIKFMPCRQCEVAYNAGMSIVAGNCTVATTNTNITTKGRIKEWLEQGKQLKATHVIVVCDTFEHEDYPVYVMSNEDVRKKVDEYNKKNMQKVMEVYNLKLNIEKQLEETRAFHYDDKI